jgi:hypothetical protein
MPSDFVTIDANGHKTSFKDNIPLSDQKKVLYDKIAEVRWQKQGITKVKGVPFASDDVAIGRVNASITMLENFGGGPVQWKIGSNQYVNVTVNDLKNIGRAMFIHIQACFLYEGKLAYMVDQAATVEDLAKIDIYHGWPE